MSAYFDVSGNEIYFDNRLVATIAPTVWPTLHDQISSVLECAGADMISEEDHEAAIKATEEEWSEQVSVLEGEKEDLESRVDELETENDGLRTTIREMESETGVAGVIDELRADLAAAHELRDQYAARLRELLKPAPKKRRAKAA